MLTACSEHEFGCCEAGKAPPLLVKGALAVNLVLDFVERSGTRFFLDEWKGHACRWE